jgi:hypothetical protein
VTGIATTSDDCIDRLMGCCSVLALFVFCLFPFFLGSLLSARLQLRSQMAASVLKHTKPDAISNDAQKTPSEKRKGKENISKPKQVPVRSEQSPAPIDDNDTVWNWASLTDPSSSRIPPAFSKDGRCVLPQILHLICDKQVM